MKLSKYLNLIFLLSALLTSNTVLAWGGRGHHTICSAATHLVKDEALKTFLKFRPHVMGHLCNIPDVYWKSLGPDINDVGSPSHYIDPEIIGLKIMVIPLDYKVIIEKYTGSDNLYKKNGKIFSIPKDFGSMWWRADQFFRLISGLKNSFANAELPKNFKEQQDDKLPYNAAVFSMMTYMGLMGHFVGDASQPFHSTANHDGYGTGHGGIHSYYEEQVVALFGPDFEKLIVDKAKTLKNNTLQYKKLVTGTPLENMQHLSLLADNDRLLIFKLDPVLKPSEVKVEKGMEIKTPAQRSPNDIGFANLKNKIIHHMARSAIVLAHLWDESYHNIGSPNLLSYKSFRYPHSPEFIPPDYTMALSPEPKK